jgi:hypothetical protein
VAADFDCGDEPGAPPQDTTKGVVEAYQTDALSWGRTCGTKLKARGADASRYGLLGVKSK